MSEEELKLARELAGKQAVVIQEEKQRTEAEVEASRRDAIDMARSMVESNLVKQGKPVNRSRSWGRRSRSRGRDRSIPRARTGRLTMDKDGNVFTDGDSSRPAPDDNWRSAYGRDRDDRGRDDRGRGDRGRDDWDDRSRDDRGRDDRGRDNRSRDDRGRDDGRDNGSWKGRDDYDRGGDRYEGYSRGRDEQSYGGGGKYSRGSDDHYGRDSDNSYARGGGDYRGNDDYGRGRDGGY